MVFAEHNYSKYTDSFTPYRTYSKIWTSPFDSSRKRAYKILTPLNPTYI